VDRRRNPDRRRRHREINTVQYCTSVSARDGGTGSEPLAPASCGHDSGPFAGLVSVLEKQSVRDTGAACCTVMRDKGLASAPIGLRGGRCHLRAAKCDNAERPLTHPLGLSFLLVFPYPSLSLSLFFQNGRCLSLLGETLCALGVRKAYISRVLSDTRVRGIPPKPCEKGIICCNKTARPLWGYGCRRSCSQDFKRGQPHRDIPNHRSFPLFSYFPNAQRR
jgi:hypothetical protein